MTAGKPELDLLRSLIGKWRREAYALERGEQQAPVLTAADVAVAAALERVANELEAIVKVLG